jgi:hypothetical protein
MACLLPAGRHTVVKQNHTDITIVGDHNMSDAPIPLDALMRLRAQARDRKRRQRDRDRRRDMSQVTDLPDVTQNVTEDTQDHAAPDHAPLPNGPPGVRWALTAVALVLFAAAVSANAEYAWSLGASPISSGVFAGIGIAADGLVFLLPLVASRSPPPIALIGWAVWTLALSFALCGAVGFASLSIADTVARRSERSSPAIEIAKLKLSTTSAAVSVECRRVGPLCRARQADERQALADLGAAESAQAAVADPQVSQAVKLVAWLTPLRPADADLAMVRLGLIVLIPQLAGLVLLVARR